MDELTAVPAAIDAGTALSIRFAPADYLASDDWELSLHLQGRAALHVDAEADGDEFVVRLSAANTSALGSGLYRHSVTVERGEGETLEGPYVIARGRVQVRPDLIKAIAGSLQDPDEKALEMLRAVKEGRITADVEGYVLDGVQIAVAPLELLDKLEAKYRRRQWRKKHPGMFAGYASFAPRRGGNAL